LQLNNVALINSDQSIGLGLEARRVRVSSNKIEFVTPARALTSTESNYRTQILTAVPDGMDEPFENPVFELIGHFSLPEVQSLRLKNGVFAKRMQAYRSHVHRYSSVLTKFYPRIDKQPVLEERDIRSLVDLQLYSEFDIIAIPEPAIDGKVDDFERNVQRFSDYIKDKGAEPMPYIDMKNDNAVFREKLSKVVQNIPNIRCLGLAFRSHSDKYPNFRAIGEVAGAENLWIHVSNVPRFQSRATSLAQMHLPQTYSIDTTALESRAVLAPLKVKPIQRIRKFVEGTLGETKLEDISTGKEPDSACACPICSATKRKGTAMIGGTLLQTDTCYKVHEVFCSTEEFGNSRDSIKNGDMKSYIQSKKYLNLTLSSV
jgi:hypothetical protein